MSSEKPTGAADSRRQSGSVFNAAETLPALTTQPKDLPGEKTEDAVTEVVVKDFGFLPIPKSLRYDLQNPTHFGLVMNIIFGLASTFIVANLYYCQPLLIQFSITFGVTYQRVSNIPTLVQAGYATGLLLISPLGDLVRRRPLIIGLTVITASLTIGLAITPNLIVFEVLSFFMGVFSVTPQILMPLAADLAPPERRASALSIVLSGLLFGVLIARVLAGIVAQFVTWRVVFYISIGMQYLLVITMYWMIPDYPAKNKGTTYFGILYSMAKYAVTEPLLIQTILITIPASATFSNWWVTLTFLLGGDRYNYSTVVIGLFGLVGMVGVAMAPLIGRTIDGLVLWSATLIGAFALLLTFALQTAAAGLNVAVIVIVCIGLDIFRQTQQVALSTAVLGLEPNARSRLNAVVILSLFIGQVMGTSVGSKVYTEHGWRASGALNLAWTGFTVLVLFLRGPHCQRYTWIGWEGGFEMRKSRVAARQQRESEAAADAQDEKEGSVTEGDRGGIAEEEIDRKNLEKTPSVGPDEGQRGVDEKGDTMV